ncbi:TPA: hypothetical protein ACH3X2_009788, partial [Trebouxia sp. C0005]
LKQQMRKQKPQSRQWIGCGSPWSGCKARKHDAMQVEHWDHLGSPGLLECSSTRAELLGQAILSQVASAVDQMLGDEEGEAEQMVAVLDARQATTLQVTRKVNLIKRLALALNQHYPARLHQLYLVDLPVVLKWVVAAVKPVLHAETRAKIQVCQLPSPVFPFPSTILDFTSPLKRISLPSAAHTSGGQVSARKDCGH